MAKTVGSPWGLAGLRFGVARGERDDAGHFLHDLDALVEGMADARVEHRSGSRSADGGGEIFGEAFKIRAAQAEDEAGFGAELADTHGDGVLEALNDLRAAFLQGAREDEERVEAAHLGEDGDGIGATGGGVEERAASEAGAGEAGGAGERMLDQRDPDFVARTVEQGKDAVGQAAFFHGADDGAGDELAGARMRAVRLDDDRIAGGEGAGGVPARHGEGEGKVAGTRRPRRGRAG